MNSSIQL